jgi:hypothetical protein
MTSRLDTTHCAVLTAHLNRGGQWAYYWTVNVTTGAKRTIWYRTEQLAPAPPSENGSGPQHVYFGVHPVAVIPQERINKKTGEMYRPRPEQVRPEIGDIAVINCLYGDFDAKDFGDDKAAILDHIEVGLAEISAPAPSVLIDSGGGYHAYWLLVTPFFLDTPEKRERARLLQERWVVFIGADASVHDLPRVLRQPGTVNWKYTPPPMADVVRADVSLVYTLDELEALLPPVAPVTMRPTVAYVAPSVPTSDHLRRWVDRRLEIAASHVANAPSGAASDERYNMGRLAGGVIDTNIYTEDEIVDRLLPYALQRSTDDAQETERNLRNGIQQGKRSPLRVPVEAFPTDQPLIIIGGVACCPSCDTRVLRSKYDYDGTSEPGWYCPQCKGQMRWPASAFAPAVAASGASDTTAEDSSIGPDEDAPRGSDTTRLTKSERIRAWLKAQGYSFRLNLAGSILECNGLPLEDYLAADIRVQYTDAELRNMGLLEDIWRAEARRNAYHPIKDYLSGLEWDGKPHIHSLASHFTSSDPEIVYDDTTRRSLVEIYLYRWLIGAVAKVFDRKQNAMLVLGGPQGIGKSEFVRWLCTKLPAHYFEGQIQPGDRDSMLRFATNFIWEVAELDATTRRADRSALKGALTQESIKLRKAYGHFDTEAPAIVSFIGTFNPDHAGFLDDPSGSRRFWITTITHINWAYQQNIDIDQVWAEAVAAYRSGKSWRLLPVEEQRRETVNQEHEVEDPILGILERYFIFDIDPTNRMSSADIILTLQEKDVALNYSNPRGLAMEIARALKKRGVAKIGDGRHRYYVGVLPR